MGKYVCCENCHLPEIGMYIKKGIIQGKCAACGWAGELDNVHKLVAFILKNPPDDSGNNLLTVETAGGKVDKKARREAKLAAKAKGEDGGSDDEEKKAKKE